MLRRHLCCIVAFMTVILTESFLNRGIVVRTKSKLQLHLVATSPTPVQTSLDDSFSNKWTSIVDGAYIITTTAEEGASGTRLEKTLKELASGKSSHTYNVHDSPIMTPTHLTLSSSFLYLSLYLPI